MKMDERSCRRHIVLLGIGHTNAHVLRMWGMNPIPDADLTCISNFGVATYSGFLPAVLAGQKTVAQMEIDLVRLSSSVGARLITDQVATLDHARNEILFANRPSIPYDVLSIGIGSVPTLDGVSVEGNSLIKIKPMQTFLDRLSAALERVPAKPRIVVVGGGVAGVEVSLCVPTFLRNSGIDSHHQSLISGGEEILPDLAAGTRAKVLKVFQRRDVKVVTNRRVTRVTPGVVTLQDGTTEQADIVIWATGATAPSLLSQLDLPLDDRGFLATNPTLQSTSGYPVFAVGDSGTIISESLPKAGVYAVRQGPVVWENIQRSLDRRNLQHYKPQRSFLRLINTGDRSAIGQWNGFALQGNWVMTLKDRIDSRFMEMFRPMVMPHDDAMQCRGCGSKLGSVDLESALAGIDDIEMEDAAQLGDSDLVASTDFFTSPFDDPYLVGRVTALHSASDIICTGANATQALANVVLPAGDATTQQKTLSDFLAGARHEFDAMGASIVGGHTIVGPRMEVGFTVIGKAIGKRLIRKRNLEVGDQLFLTKPIGIGILLAAHMRSLCPAAVYQKMVDNMLLRQHATARTAINAGVVAGTDVTGFGLAGHLIEMLQASNVSATINLSNIPLLDGVEACLEIGVESTLAPANRRFESMIDGSDAVAVPAYRAMFDPQTCGGLLLAVAPSVVDTFLAELSHHAAPLPAMIGQVVPQGSRVNLLHINL